VREAFRNPDVDGDFAIEFQIVRADAAIGFIQMRADVIRGAAGAPLRLVGVSMDISERLKASEEKSLARCGSSPTASRTCSPSSTA
jgi:PAS domain-containing protein